VLQVPHGVSLRANTSIVNAETFSFLFSFRFKLKCGNFSFNWFTWNRQQQSVGLLDLLSLTSTIRYYTQQDALFSYSSNINPVRVTLQATDRYTVRQTKANYKLTEMKDPSSHWATNPEVLPFIFPNHTVAETGK
jgi:hypothetical protein